MSDKITIEEAFEVTIKLFKDNQNELNQTKEKLAKQAEISVKALEVLEYIATRNLIKAWTCDNGSIQELKTKINELNILTGNSEVVNE